MTPDPHHHVKVELAKAVDVLILVHQPYLGFDPQPLQVANIGQDNALKGGADKEDLEAKRRPGLCIHQLEILNRPSGVLEQGIGPAQVFTQPAAAVRHGWGICFAENRLRHLAAKRFQYGEFFPLGLAPSREIGIREIAAGPGVLTVEEVTVGPFKIKSEREGFAHPRVRELLAAGIHDEGLHAGGPAVCYQFLFQPAFLDNRDVVVFCPGLRLILQSIIDIAGFERQADRRCITEEVGPDRLEILHPPAYREIPAPVVFNALPDRKTPRLKFADLVRPAAQWGFQCRGAKVPGRPVVFGQDRQLTHDEGQLTVVRFAESKPYPRGIQRLGRRDRAVIEPVLRITLTDQGFKRPGDIFGSDGRPIMPARLRTKMENHPGTIAGPFNGFSNQAVTGERFVGTRDQQGFHCAGTDRVTLGDEGVKTVKTPLGRKP